MAAARDTRDYLVQFFDTNTVPRWIDTLTDTRTLTDDCNCNYQCHPRLARDAWLCFASHTTPLYSTLALGLALLPTDVYTQALYYVLRVQVAYNVCFCRLSIYASTLLPPPGGLIRCGRDGSTGTPMAARAAAAMTNHAGCEDVLYVAMTRTTPDYTSSSRRRHGSRNLDPPTVDGAGRHCCPRRSDLVGSGGRESLADGASSKHADEQTGGQTRPPSNPLQNPTEEAKIAGSHSRLRRRYYPSSVARPNYLLDVREEESWTAVV
ncbi:hypothetical protein CMUS01_06152 [Colletotrichum musicola]|uniref:Uncharacterized protein n=1 Tax=Colletotrichum musicola TaxID=2175873 RepID=A0A8H6KN82_9PEZI|nr:hypothetical protein CMUS01_06152 [Colletotrichum musicola]